MFFVFVMMRFYSINATRSHCSVFVQKRREKPSFLCVHIYLPDNKYGAKDIRFCAFTLLRVCEAHYWILERFQKPPFLCVHMQGCRELFDAQGQNYEVRPPANGACRKFFDRPL